MEGLKEFIKNHKKVSIIAISILLIIIVGYFIYYEIEIHNDIKYAMHFVKENYDYKQFNKTLIEYGYNKESVKQKAYNQFCNFVQEELENIKNGNKNEKLEEMLKSIQKDDIDRCLRENEYLFTDKIDEYTLLVKDYNNFCDIQEKINKEEYTSAFEDLEEFSKRNADNEITRKSKSMQKDIESKAIEEVKEKANGVIKANKKKYENYVNLEELETKYESKTLKKTVEEVKLRYNVENKAIQQALEESKNEYKKGDYEEALDILALFSPYNIKEIEEYRREIETQQDKIDYERYCYFNLIAVKNQNITDDEAFKKVANRFNTTKKSVIESYDRVNSKGGWWYQDKYSDIFERYAKQY